MDRGAWGATVRGVERSRTRLSVLGHRPGEPLQGEACPASTAQTQGVSAALRPQPQDCLWRSCIWVGVGAALPWVSGRPGSWLGAGRKRLMAGPGIPPLPRPSPRPLALHLASSSPAAPGQGPQCLLPSWANSKPFSPSPPRAECLDHDLSPPPPEGMAPTSLRDFF